MYIDFRKIPSQIPSNIRATYHKIPLIHLPPSQDIRINSRCQMILILILDLAHRLHFWMTMSHPQQLKESVVDGACRRQQWQQEDVDAVIIREEDKDTEKQKENNDVPALNAEQDNEHSTTTQESVVDDGHG